MSINLVSTTDSPEAVQAALGHSKGSEKVEAPSAPGVKAPEQKPAATSEAAESEANEVEDDSADREEAEPEQTDESDKDKTPKKSGFQKRIDKLNARARAAQQETEYWKQQALKGAGSNQETPKVETKAEPSEGKPVADKFDTHAEYVEALADWKTDQKLKERDQKQEQSRLQTEQAGLLKSHNDRIKSFADKTDDFGEMMGNLDDVRSPVMQQIIVESEHGPALLYELAKDPEEALRISKLSPLAIARELGKLESKLTPTASEKKPEPKKKTEAPAPVTPVGSKGGSAHKPLDEMDYQEFKRARAAQLTRR